jgi:hypothetical protein
MTQSIKAFSNPISLPAFSLKNHLFFRICSLSSVKRLYKFEEVTPLKVAVRDIQIFIKNQNISLH